jgi:2-amino-4-hydroxy-6-hydroxymethyldihydropteridine diphosphokinase
MRKTTVIYLLTGSNIEPRLENVNRAEVLIARHIGSIIRKSSIYQSPPWGFDAETFFLNQVICVSTHLTATEVLESILKIEKMMGRERSGKSYTSRNIDIDLLYYGQETLETSSLVIPHPRLHERRFTLQPLVEIAEDFIHPVLGKSNLELLRSCPDRSMLTLFK